MPALAAEEVQRVAARPWIGGVTDRASRLLREKRPPAMIAGHRLPRGADVVFAANFVAIRAAPTDGHFGERIA